MRAKDKKDKAKAALAGGFCRNYAKPKGFALVATISLRK